MAQTAAQLPNYDERVNETLRRLASGETREDIAQSFQLSSWKSLDIYFRRKGFSWDSTKGTYKPTSTKVDKILKEAASGITVKAEQIIRLFDKEDADPKNIACQMGFENHREMAEYMERKGLKWDSETENYVEQIVSNADAPENKVLNLNERKAAHQPSSVTEDASFQAFLPLLLLLERNKERLLDLLMPASEGNIPKYAVPGVPKTKSIYMSDLLARLASEFSESKNLSQREIVEAALIEHLKRYGFQHEVEKMLAKK